MYTKETRYALTYIGKDGNEKTCYPGSEKKKDENIAYCVSHDIRVLSCKKLYPFSTMKNQHNFNLLIDVCANAMDDMDSGEKEYDDKEYSRLADIRHKAGEFFCLPLPIAWLTYDKWQEANELANAAIIHRQNACIANGRPDLVTYC